MTDPFELLTDLGEPRPLPAALRDRLETALLGADAARPLPLSLRASLAGQLERRPARRIWGVAAGVALVASAAGVLVMTRSPRDPAVTAARPPSASSTASPSSAPAVGGTTGGTAAVGEPPVAAPAAPAPAAVGAPGVSGSGAQAGGVAAGAAQGSASGAHSIAVTPDAGPLHGGTTVRLRGSGLRTASRVTFGRAAGTNLQVHPDGSVSVRTPAVSAAGSVTVVVHLRDGSQVARANGFTYVARPELDSATPSSGPSSGGTWVTLDGVALSRVTSVRFGDVVAPELKVLSDTRVQARIPAHSPGAVDVTVVTPGGTSDAVRFLYLP
ncbi:MAG: IPT/TIG domain-containing protein [Frankiaceae bacterium]|nr:IPT/TIG domain-containing protein [Frankiaceae bacterium]